MKSIDLVQHYINEISNYPIEWVMEVDSYYYGKHKLSDNYMVFYTLEYILDLAILCVDISIVYDTQEGKKHTSQHWYYDLYTKNLAKEGCLKSIDEIVEDLNRYVRLNNF